MGFSLFGGGDEEKDGTCIGCGRSLTLSADDLERLDNLRKGASKEEINEALDALSWGGARALTLPGDITVGACNSCFLSLKRQLGK